MIAAMQYKLFFLPICLSFTFFAMENTNLDTLKKNELIEVDPSQKILSIEALKTLIHNDEFKDITPQIAKILLESSWIKNYLIESYKLLVLKCNR